MGAGRDLITQDNGWIVKSDSLESLYQAMSAAIQLNAAQQLQMSQAAESSVANHQLADGVERFVALVAVVSRYESSTSTFSSSI